MKKILSVVTLFTVLFIGANAAKADDAADAKEFFNSYVNAANSYSTNIPDFYSPKAKIIRQVIENKTGKLVNAYTDTATYMKQLKLSSATAKLRKYKNTYRNITVAKVADGYKISAERQPSGETYWLQTYQIVQKQPDGKWKIIEEMMQTKEQIFLRYAK